MVKKQNINIDKIKKFIAPNLLSPIRYCLFSNKHVR